MEDALHGINEIARESLGDTRKAVRALTEFDGAANGDDTHTKNPASIHGMTFGRFSRTHAGWHRHGVHRGLVRAPMTKLRLICVSDVTREAITNAIRHGQNSGAYLASPGTTARTAPSP